MKPKAVISEYVASVVGFGGIIFPPLLIPSLAYMAVVSIVHQ